MGSSSAAAAALLPATALPNMYQGVQKESAGYKLLASMGWREGDGLGAKKQGIKEHVKVKKKFDAMGVGAAEQVQHTRDWTTGMASFDQILSGLKEVSAAKRPAAQSASEQSSGSLQQASAGKQRAAKALKKRKAPCPSTSSASSSSGDDEQASGSASSSSDDEQAAPVAAKRVKLASHVGRYMKRERGKTVKNYSASDLDAILGGKGASAAAEQQPQDDDCDGQAGAGAFPKFAEVRAAPRTSSGSASSGGSDADDEQEEDGDAGDSNAAANRKLSGKAASSTKRDGGGEQQRRPSDGAAVPPGPPLWWASLFVRAGRMGSTNRELRGRAEKAAAAAGKGQQAAVAAASTKPGAINVTGFKEQDQENLYEQVQNNATHGRQGLGRADAPKKVAGARWCGTKVRLGSDDEDEGDEQGGEAAARGDGGGSSSSGEEELTRVVVMQPRTQQRQRDAVPAGTAAEPGGAAGAERAGKASKKRTAQGGAAVVVAPGTAKGEGDGSAEGAKIKWRKLAKQVLSSAPKRRLKHKRLHKQLAKCLGLPSGGGPALSLDRVLAKLRAKPGFSVCDKFVRLEA